MVTNNAYQVGDLLFHPGDSFTMPRGTIRILLLPAGGPWMKLSESIDYLRAVAPEIAIPIHQAGLASVHQQLHTSSSVPSRRPAPPSASSTTAPRPHGSEERRKEKDGDYPFP
jgi:hypothetical protein